MDTSTDPFWEVEATISVYDLLDFEDVAGLAQELNDHFLTVRTSRTNFRPSMAAGPDLAVVLYLGASTLAVIGLKKVVELLVEDAYKAVRTGLLRLVRKVREKDQHRTWNLGIYVGNAPFYFVGPLDDATLSRALGQARPVLDVLPEAILDETAQPRSEAGGAGFWWRNEAGLWVPTPMMDAAMRGDVEVSRRKARRF